MPGFSRTLAQDIFNATLASSRTTLTAKPGVWISLHTGAPDDNGAGSEATYSGYARVNISSLMTSSVVGTAPEQSIRATNTGDINFPASTGATQTVTHWAIWSDASLASGANMMYSGALSSSRAVQSGDVVSIPAGQLVVDLI